MTLLEQIQKEFQLLPPESKARCLISSCSCKTKQRQTAQKNFHSQSPRLWLVERAKYKFKRLSKEITF